MEKTNQSTHHVTAQKDRIPFFQKAIYSIGSLANSIQAAAIGAMVIVLNLGLGMNPALVGIIGMIPRIIDALLDPLVGYSSDNARTRWGRRRPFIFFGSIASGILYALMFQLYPGQSEIYYFWYFLGFLTILLTSLIGFIFEPEFGWIVFSVLLGGSLMIIGYFLYQQFFLGVAALAEIPINIGQMVIGLIVAIPIVRAIWRSLPSIKK